MGWPATCSPYPRHRRSGSRRSDAPGDDDSLHFEGASPVLSDYDGTTGTLLLVTSSTAAERVATGVPVGSFSNHFSFPALGYLRDFDPSLGAAPWQSSFSIADTFERPGVSEWSPVTWPADGVLYVVPMARTPASGTPRPGKNSEATLRPEGRQHERAEYRISATGSIAVTLHDLAAAVALRTSATAAIQPVLPRGQRFSARRSSRQ